MTGIKVWKEKCSVEHRCKCAPSQATVWVGGSSKQEGSRVRELCLGVVLFGIQLVLKVVGRNEAAMLTWALMEVLEDPT